MVVATLFVLCSNVKIFVYDPKRLQKNNMFRFVQKWETFTIALSICLAPDKAPSTVCTSLFLLGSNIIPVALSYHGSLL